MRQKVVQLLPAKTNPRSRKREKRHWYSGDVPLLPLGCSSCSHRDLCGGLRVDERIFDCTSYCRCADSSTCDNVCPARPDHFVSRVSEVEGFELNTVPRGCRLNPPELPSYIPLIMHGSRRHLPLSADAVAISLGTLLNRRDGTGRFQSAEELRNHFLLSPTTNIIVSGTAEDRNIERVWALEDPRAFAVTLKSLGVAAFTSPNFSLFNDVPRWDNFYNMKRIALCWQLLQEAGMFSPLHINARTDRDWERWTQFVAERPEVGALSFEFGTGAGWPSRQAWYIDRLMKLGQSISRPLQLYMRGGLEGLTELRSTYSAVKVIDTRPFMKAVNRQGADIDVSGQLTWSPAPTLFGQDLDDLLALNIAACRLDVLTATRRR